MTTQGLLAFLCFFSKILDQTFGLICEHTVVVENWQNPDIELYFCEDFVDVCCEEGCCPRFQETHIWLIVSSFSFVFFLSAFGIWCCFCRKKFGNKRFRRRRGEDNVDSPLTRAPEGTNVNLSSSPERNYNPSAPPPLHLTIVSPTSPNSNNGAANTSVANQNTSMTPPPSYEEATAPPIK